MGFHELDIAKREEHYDRVMLVEDDVYREMNHQLRKWGIQDHSTERWMTILMEEVGEAAMAANKGAFHPDKKLREQYLDNYYEELIDSAAVCIAAAENIVRQRKARREVSEV